MPDPSLHQRIPLFPLNTVLFPGMLLPLQIFEPRYLELLHDCLEASLPFGVCLIREGPEVGGPAVPCTVGTTCEILRAEPAEGGRFHLLTVGRKRFRIHNLIWERSYLEAEVEYLPPDDAGGLADLPERVRALAEQLLRRLLARSGAVSALELPTDAEALSFMAAGLLAGTELPLCQELLEMESLQTRLEREATMLSRRLEMLGTGEPGSVAARPYRVRNEPFRLN